MGRGGAPYTSYTTLLLLSTTTTTLIPGANALCAFCNLWKVSIDESPAPSPEDGPPFSAHAIRNKAVLPYEIIGIVGAYIVSVFILGTLLLTIGRHLRKKAQAMASKPTELVKPMMRNFDPSPISPNGTRTWYPRKLRGKKSATSSIRSGTSNFASPGMDSVVSFDAHVVEGDRARNQEQMERLYAAVMAHDDRKSLQNATTTEIGVEDGGPPEYQQRRPLNVVTDAPGMRHLQAPELSPRSPRTPKSPMRAIYPPDAPMPNMPLSPTSPMRAEYQGGDFRPDRQSRASSLPSIRSGNSTNTRSEGKAKGGLRKGLRNLKISAPLHGDDNSDGARTPLSLRFYTDPGVPPEPPMSARTIDSGRYPPDTPGTAGTGRSYRFDDEAGEFEEEEEEHLDEVRDLPQAHPNRVDPSGYDYANPAQAVTNAASARRDPTGTTAQNKQGNAAAAAAIGGARPLPFRQLNTNLPPPTSPSHTTAAYPLSPGTWNRPQQLYPMSASSVKTQFVSPRKDTFGGPRTGMATPYSPYMPFTPLTPVTPRLTSRAERKQRVKEERKMQGVITEEDAVADEKELWSSGY